MEGYPKPELDPDMYIPSERYGHQLSKTVWVRWNTSTTSHIIGVIDKLVSSIQNVLKTPV